MLILWVKTMNHTHLAKLYPSRLAWAKKEVDFEHQKPYRRWHHDIPVCWVMWILIRTLTKPGKMISCIKFHQITKILLVTSPVRSHEIIMKITICCCWKTWLNHHELFVTMKITMLLKTQFLMVENHHEISMKSAASPGRWMAMRLCYLLLVAAREPMETGWPLEIHGFFIGGSPLKWRSFQCGNQDVGKLTDWKFRSMENFHILILWRVISAKASWTRSGIDHELSRYRVHKPDIILCTIGHSSSPKNPL